LPGSRLLAPPKTIDYSTASRRSTNGVITAQADGIMNIATESRTESRVNTPNFFTLKKSSRPVNPYTMTELQDYTRYGYQRVESLDDPLTKTIYTWVGPTQWFFSTPAADLSYDPSVRSLAFKRLRDEMGNDPFNIAVDLVQFRQTTNMIAANALRIVRSYTALKRGNFSRAINEVFDNRPPKFRKGEAPSAEQSLANNWLELQYGWKPLLNDIDELIRHTHLTYRADLRVVRGTAKSVSTTSTPLLGPLFATFTTVPLFEFGQRVTQKATNVKIGMRYKVSDPDQAFLAQTGFTNPVNLAWELIPFSFVADWFLPIGPYLESLSAFEGLTFVDGFETRFVRETQTTNVVVNTVKGTAPFRVAVKARMGTDRVSVNLTRLKLTTFPEIPSAQFKNPISVTHAANAVALLQATFKTFKKG